MFLSKKELKSMCLPRMLELCEKVGLSKQQKSVLIERCNKNHDILTTSCNLGMCETSVKKHYREALRRIADYQNYVDKER